MRDLVLKKYYYTLLLLTISSSLVSVGSKEDQHVDKNGQLIFIHLKRHSKDLFRSIYQKNFYF